MTQFMQFNLANVNSDEDSVRIIHNQDVCMCCLSSNMEVVSLANCKHTSIFELFFKFKFQYENSVICMECHNLLNKFEKFKLQIEKCLSILWSKQVPPAVPPKKFQNLICTEIQFANSSDAIDVKPIYESTKAPITNSEQSHHVLTTEVKDEYESSDTETTTPLSEIRKEIKKVKMKKGKTIQKVVHRKRSQTDGDDKYEGKIVVRNLDKDELMKEREKEALNKFYLKLPYKCEHCIIGFDHAENLSNHMKKRHTVLKNGFICDICKSVFNTATVCRKHTKKHFKRYECVECGKRTSSIYSLVKHYKSFHGDIDTKFNCSECDFTTDSNGRFRYHRAKHKKVPACDECGNTFATRSGLKVHMLTVHSRSDRVYSCATCGKVYRAKSGLLAHVHASHSAVMPSYCSFCRTHFRTEQGLLHHLKTHSAHVSDNDKRFTCDECGSRFLSKAALQEHSNFVHLKKSTHECDQCSKVFKNASYLKKHVNYVHEKMRPPRNKICDHCGKGFTTLSILRSHIRTHTGERPLQCANCPATFAHSAALYTHNKLLHSGTRKSR